MFNPTVQLKSGGYIVIGVTEALVAIDINSGKSTREGSIEDTALKTNLEAADEIARQLRLRDLAGLIVIDFIDMEERKNNAAVEKRLKEKLKNDRARIQVGRISGFGLLEMSRQRLRPGMLEATTQPCPHCHGTGLIRSDNSLALSILRALEEEGTREKTREALVRAPVSIVNYLFNAKREHLAQIEARYGMAIRIEADPSLVSPDFAIEKFKTATRVVQVPIVPVVSLDARTMSDIDDVADEAEDDEAEAETEAAVETATETAESDQGEGGRKKRRRRRRRRGGQNGEAAPDQAARETSEQPAEGVDTELPEPVAADTAPAESETAAETSEKPARKRRSRRKPASLEPAEAEAAAEPARDAEPESSDETAATVEAPSPAASPKPRARRARRPKSAVEAAPEVAPAPLEEVSSERTAPGGDASEPVAVAAHEDRSEPAMEKPAATFVPTEPESVPEPEQPAEPEPDQELAQEREAVAAEADEETPSAPAKPRRRGWWSLGRGA
jgi:ribonuclease E